jgi:flagellar motor switch protein FliM
MSDSEVLSQDEMDALMNGVDEGDIEANEKKSPGTVTGYDFAQPAHKFNVRLPMLEVINNALAKQLGIDLSNRLHQTITVSAASVSSQKFRDFIHTLPESVSISKLDLAPLPETALLMMEGTLVFSLVDRFFGGDGKHQEKGNITEFSPTEQRLLQRLRDSFLTALQQAWQPIIDIKPAIKGMVNSQQITSLAGMMDIALIMTFTLEFADSKGVCHLVMPYIQLEPVRPALGRSTEQQQRQDAEWSQTFGEQLLECELEVKGIVAEISISLDQLLNLKPGDFIPLSQRQTALFSSENMPLFEAEVGVTNGQVSARLVHWQNPTPIYH